MLMFTRKQRSRLSGSAKVLGVAAVAVLGALVSPGPWATDPSAGALGVTRTLAPVPPGSQLHAPSRSSLPLSGPPPATRRGSDLPRWVHSGRSIAVGRQRATDVSHPTLLASSNWSGVIDTGTTYSAVEGDWIVPWPVASTGPGLASTWIGISGVKDNALIQVGVTETVTGGTVTYAPWYELIPAPSIQIDQPVSHGDHMRALILQKAPQSWYIGIEDLTRGWVVTGVVAYTASLANSAEWITERPTTGSTGSLFTLPNYGKAQFHDLRLNGVDLTASQITYAFMTDTAKAIISYPSKLAPTTTGSFSDTYGTPLPTVTSVSPDHGGSVGGTTVTVTGTYIVPTLIKAVTFGTRPAEFSVSGTGSITANAPPQTAGTVDVTVTTTDGTSVVTGADEFTYEAPPPVVSAVHPATGPTSGGTVVTVTGSNFTGVSSVQFGSTPAATIRVISPLRLVATSPAHAAGPVTVTVSTTYGVSTASSGATFRYLAPTVISVSPHSGPQRGGTTVTITGSGFSRGATVWFGNTRARRTIVVSPTRIVATSPRGRHTVHVSVAIREGRSTASPTNAFRYR